MEKVFKVDGMSCQHCVMAVKKEIQKLDIQNFQVVIGEVKVEFDEKRINEENIKKAIKDAGYIVTN